MPSSRSLTADNPQVESTFQIDTESLQGGLPKVEIPREYSTIKHKVNSFSRWSSHLRPIIDQVNKPQVAERKLVTYSEMNDGDLPETMVSLSRPEQKNRQTPIGGHTMDNQQSLDVSHIPGSYAFTNMANCDIYSCYEECSGSGEQLLDLQPWVLVSQHYHLQDRSTMTDDHTLH